MSKEKRFVIQVDPLEIEDDAIFDNKELRLYECQSDMMSDICSLLNKQENLQILWCRFQRIFIGGRNDYKTKIRRTY